MQNSNNNNNNKMMHRQQPLNLLLTKTKQTLKNTLLVDVNL